MSIFPARLGQFGFQNEIAYLDVADQGNIKRGTYPGFVCTFTIEVQGFRGLRVDPPGRRVTHFKIPNSRRTAEILLVKQGVVFLAIGSVFVTISCFFLIELQLCRLSIGSMRGLTLFTGFFLAIATDNNTKEYQADQPSCHNSDNSPDRQALACVTIDIADTVFAGTELYLRPSIIEFCVKVGDPVHA